MTRGALALALAASMACRAHRVEVETPQCSARDGELAAGVDAGALEGEYIVTLVATGGEQAGQEHRGEMVLLTLDSAAALSQAPAHEAQGKAGYSLVGTTDLALESVGAVRLGDLASLDPAKPGVAVLQHGEEQAPEITLRLGSLANQVGNVRFDGGYAALHVKWLESDGFGGSWESGVRGPEAEGYFCAFRPVAGR
jgi:hypothetical protein